MTPERSDCCRAAEKRTATDCAHFFAGFFVALAGPVLRQYGADGERLLRSALRDFGRARGARIRQRVDALRLAPDVENFSKCYDFPMLPGFEATREITPERKTALISLCPLAEQWKNSGEARLGLLYCEEVDAGIREGFSSEMIHMNLRNPLRGDRVCEQVDTLGEVGARDLSS
ncbi:MAG: L-2-amino-thiazoline-4-carboxylic acid hydrolase [Deltaproteobacteria bacterium]|nr:L-2-amino-thiazoline-4-carboxylic acid hydrolase [Deltaproteobacteria bacterium]